MALTKIQRRNRIKNRIRKVVSGTAAKPRLSVFRSNKGISAQLIDDVAGTTLVSASSLTLGLWVDTSTGLMVLLSVALLDRFNDAELWTTP